MGMLSEHQIDRIHQLRIRFPTQKVVQARVVETLVSGNMTCIVTGRVLGYSSTLSKRGEPQLTLQVTGSNPSSSFVGKKVEVASSQIL